MHFLTLHYTNIGPFAGQTIKLRPRLGSFLIKAPIGSGKSFLFFDGPIFALYKTGARKMLNKNSQTGQVVVERVIEGVQYCIIRDLKKTPKGESVSSKLFHRSYTPVEQSDTLYEMTDVDLYHVDPRYEPVDVKNEGELQKLLDDLLPPKEVFLGTVMLMQDSDNIFDLPPKERLEIFKHVFGLIGIDESKDLIADKKREYGAMIKARSDLSQYDDKLRIGMTSLRGLWADMMAQSQRYTWTEASWTSRSSWMNDQHLLGDKVLIDQLALPEMLDYPQYEKDLHQRIDANKQLTTQIELHTTQLQTQKNQLTTLNTQQSQLTIQITQLQSQLNSYDPSRYEALSTQLHTQQQALEEYATRHPVQTVVHQITTYLTKLAHPLEFYPQEVSDIPALWQLIQSIITHAKDLKHQIELKTSQQTHLQTQKEEILTQIMQSAQQLREFEQTMSQTTVFHCNKIQSACPYIDMINSASIKKLNTQLTLLQQQHQTLVDRQTAIIAQIQVFSSDPMMKQMQDDTVLLADLMKQISRKEREQHQQVWTRMTQEMQTTQQSRSALQTQQAQLQSIQDQIKNLESQVQSTLGQTKSLTEQITTLESQIADYRTTQSQQIPLAQLQTDIQLLQRHAQYVDRLSQLITDYKTNQVLVSQRKQQEKQLGELYTIFSKELLLIVVKQNLPAIQDLMNFYLSQVVEYALDMQIDKKSATTETLELLVTVTDQHGVRDISSLSGGQKVILKLVWMMAISTIMGSKMLFLDETINNLDGDTVARVAEMLQNFIKGRGSDFQLYVVTHSHQIQDMGIWDGVVDVKSVKL